MAAKKKASKKKAAAKPKAAAKKADPKQADAPPPPPAAGDDRPSDKVAEAVMAALAEAAGAEEVEPARARKPIPTMPKRHQDGAIRLALGSEPDAAVMG